MALSWAKKSETAWLKFYEEDANWHNSYFFYAWALGFQNRIKEADQAFLKKAQKSQENLKIGMPLKKIARK